MQMSSINETEWVVTVYVYYLGFIWLSRILRHSKDAVATDNAMSDNRQGILVVLKHNLANLENMCLGRQ